MLWWQQMARIAKMIWTRFWPVSRGSWIRTAEVIASFLHSFQWSWFRLWSNGDIESRDHLALSERIWSIRTSCHLWRCTIYVCGCVSSWWWRSPLLSTVSLKWYLHFYQATYFQNSEHALWKFLSINRCGLMKKAAEWLTYAEVVSSLLQDLEMLLKGHGNLYSGGNRKETSR